MAAESWWEKKTCGAFGLVTTELFIVLMTIEAPSTLSPSVIGAKPTTNKGDEPTHYRARLLVFTSATTKGIASGASVVLLSTLVFSCVLLWSRLQNMQKRHLSFRHPKPF